MRIAIDCRLWHEGGVGRYLRNLIYELSKIDLKNEYTLFFHNKAPVIGKENFRTQVTNAKWHTLAEQFIFGRELAEGQFSLVHFPYFSHPVFYRRPFVITIHDLTIKHFPTGRATTKSLLMYKLKHQAYLKVLAHGVRESRDILVPSQFVKDDLLANYKVSENKIKVTYEGLGNEFNGVRPTKPANAPSNFLLYVGNSYPHKNVEFLLKVLVKIQIKESLVVYGPEDFFTTRLKRLVTRLGLGDKIIFMKHQTEAELIWLYAHAKALVLPSLGEGFGLPVVEAARFNCPQVLSNLPVFREIAPPGTVFFDPRDELSLAQQLSNLPKQVKVGEAYFAKFSFAKMARETLAVYNNWER